MVHIMVLQFWDFSKLPLSDFCFFWQTECPVLVSTVLTVLFHPFSTKKKSRGTVVWSRPAECRRGRVFQTKKG